MGDEPELELLLRRWEAVRRESAALLRACDELLLRFDPPRRAGALPPGRARRRRRPHLRVLRHPALPSP